MTAMVGEFPELQGTMGRYYAQRRASRTKSRWRIEEHYRPRYAGDALPTAQDRPGAGARRQDRYAGRHLRHRAAPDRHQGSVWLAPCRARRAAHPARGPARSGLAELLARIGRSCSRCSVPALPQEVYDFIAERLRGLCSERADGTTAEMIDAVLAAPAALAARCGRALQALQGFLRCRKRPVLTALNKRIVNILRKAPLPADARGARPAAFTEECRAQAASRAQRIAAARCEPRSPTAAMRKPCKPASRCVPPVDDFFERIMVMDENPERSTIRLALLRDVAAAARRRRRLVAPSRADPIACNSLGR